MFDLLGLRRDPRDPHMVDAARVAAIEQIVRNDDMHRLLRQVKQGGLKLQQLQAESESKSHLVQLYASQRLIDPERLNRDVQTVEDRLDEICQRFERKLHRRRQTRALRQFARAVTGTAALAKEATSIVENADKLTRHLP